MLRRSLQLLYYRTEWFCCCAKLRPSLMATKVFYSTYDKDLPNPALPTPLSKLYTHDTDILLEQIRRSKNTDRLLELIAMHLDVMNTKHIVETLQQVDGLSKTSDFNKRGLQENKIFQGLCSRLMKSVRLLGPSDVITVYKVLSSVGIRNNTYVMQVILKMMGSQLNNMSLSQIIFLHFLLSKQKPNALADGLKLALPLVLQVQIEQQLDSDNINEVVDCLQLASKSRLKPSIIERVMSVLVKKAALLSASNATTIIFSLLNLEMPVDGYKELLEYSFKILSKNCDSITPNMTLNILRHCRNRSYYDSPFLFSVANKIISERWSLDLTYEAITYFNRISFAPHYFVDYFVSVICAESDTLRTQLNFSPLSCLEYISSTGYLPPRASAALEILCSLDQNIAELTQKSPGLLLKLTACSAMCRHFPKNHLDLVLNPDFLFNAWSISKKQGRARDFEINVSALAWSLQVYDMSEVYKFPPAVLQKLVSSVVKQYDAEDQSSTLVQRLIAYGIGGEQFLKSGLFTYDGICIDLVLGMRSGNYPVVLQASNSDESYPMLSSSIKFVEDLIPPEDVKIVTVIVAHEDQYCRDPEVLKGWAEVKIKCLIKKGYCPVVINLNRFKEMPDREKIPYLMREIKQATEGHFDVLAQ